MYVFSINVVTEADSGINEGAQVILFIGSEGWRDVPSEVCHVLAARIHCDEHLVSVWRGLRE